VDHAVTLCIRTFECYGVQTPNGTRGSVPYGRYGFAPPPTAASAGRRRVHLAAEPPVRSPNRWVWAPRGSRHRTQSVRQRPDPSRYSPLRQTGPRRSRHLTPTPPELTTTPIW